MSFKNRFNSRLSNPFDLDNFSTNFNAKIIHAQRKRLNSYDLFEGDPFKIQSYKFHYADRPKFYSVGGGRSTSKFNNTNLTLSKKNLSTHYYNYDHTIPNRNKENTYSHKFDEFHRGPARGFSSSGENLRKNSARLLPKAKALFKRSNQAETFHHGSERQQRLRPLSTGYAREFGQRKSLLHSQSNESNISGRGSCASAARSRRLDNTSPQNPSRRSSDVREVYNENLVKSGHNIKSINNEASRCHISININGVPENQMQVHESDTDTSNLWINVRKPATKRQRKGLPEQLTRPKRETSPRRFGTMMCGLEPPRETSHTNAISSANPTRETTHTSSIPLASRSYIIHSNGVFTNAEKPFSLENLHNNSHNFDRKKSVHSLFPPEDVEPKIPKNIQRSGTSSSLSYPSGGACSNQNNLIQSESLARRIRQHNSSTSTLLRRSCSSNILENQYSNCNSSARVKEGRRPSQPREQLQTFPLRSSQAKLFRSNSCQIMPRTTAVADRNIAINNGARKFNINVTVY